MNEKTFLDKKYKLINGIIDIFRSMVYLDKWKQIENEISYGTKEDFVKKKFIAALCTSCYGSTYDIFDSFNDILQGNRLDDFSNIQIAIANYKELIRIYGKAYEKVLKEYENLKIEVHHIKEVLIEVESECFSLSISNPQFQKKIENFMKSKDKSEKNLQIILDDLTYLIDKLNRILNKKT